MSKQKRVDRKAFTNVVAAGKKPRRRNRRHDSERQLSVLEVTDDNAHEARRIQQTLLCWSAYMFTLSPGFMGRLYAAVADEWSQHVRGVLYDVETLDEPLDRANVAFNSQILTSLWKAQGDDKGKRWERPAEERLAFLEMAAPLLRELADDAEAGLLNTVVAVRVTDDQAVADANELASLREKFQRLERLPENEAVALRLESEIYKLESAIGEDEWPDMIG